MITVIGIVVIFVGLIAWAGQSLAFIAPNLATKLGVLEPREDMDETLYIFETKALGLNDMLLTWTLPLAGTLMLLGNPMWPYFGLIGGGIFLYFSGMIIFSRYYLKRSGIMVGGPSSEKAAYIMSGAWIIASILMIILSIMHLSQ